MYDCSRNYYYSLGNNKGNYVLSHCTVVQTLLNVVQHCQLQNLNSQSTSEIQGYWSLLSQCFVLIFHVGCEGLSRLQYLPISQRNFSKHQLRNLATDGINSFVV